MFQPRKSRHLRTGARGEFIAAWYLRLKGYRVLERNFRCPLGEIDIIMRKNSLVVFVEVRTRTSGSLLHPLETVDPVKVSRTVSAARLYLARFRGSSPQCRFDIVAVTSGGIFPARGILHVRDAFNLTSVEYRDGCRRQNARKRGRFGKMGKGKPGSGN